LETEGMKKIHALDVQTIAQRTRTLRPNWGQQQAKPQSVHAFHTAKFGDFGTRTSMLRTKKWQSALPKQFKDPTLVGLLGEGTDIFF